MCAYMFMYALVYMFMYMGECVQGVPVSGKQRTTLGVIPRVCFLCFETGPPTIAVLVNEARLAGKPQGPAKLSLPVTYGSQMIKAPSNVEPHVVNLILSPFSQVYYFP